MDQLVHLLTYPFVQNAIAAGIVIAVVSGIVSRFVVARNMAFAVHALAELGFTGSAGAILLGVSPVIGLMAGTTIRPCSSARWGCGSGSATRSSGW